MEPGKIVDKLLETDEYDPKEIIRNHKPPQTKRDVVNALIRQYAATIPGQGPPGTLQADWVGKDSLIITTEKSVDFSAILPMHGVAYDHVALLPSRTHRHRHYWWDVGSLDKPFEPGRGFGGKMRYWHDD